VVVDSDQSDQKAVAVAVAEEGEECWNTDFLVHPVENSEVVGDHQTHVVVAAVVPAFEVVDFQMDLEAEHLAEQ
jgi:hypothetical protein